MAQIVLLLFGSVLLALSLSQEMSSRCLQLAVQKTNGCSVPAGLWAPYKNTLLPLVTNMISATSVYELPYKY